MERPSGRSDEFSSTALSRHCGGAGKVHSEINSYYIIHIVYILNIQSYTQTKSKINKFYKFEKAPLNVL